MAVLGAIPPSPPFFHSQQILSPQLAQRVDILGAPFLIHLGYMDTLVHFGHFSLSLLEISEIDSWVVAN